MKQSHLLVDYLNDKRKPWERCVTKAFRDLDSDASTALFAKGKKRIEILHLRKDVWQ